MSSEEGKIERRIRISRFFGFAFGILAVALAFYPAIQFKFVNISYNAYGDFVGGVSGSLLSLAAMAFVYMTYLIQRKQIVIQQDLISEQKKEIERQKSDSVEIAKKAKIKELDDRFFLLLQLHNQTVSLFQIRNSAGTVLLRSGKDCFEEILNELREKCNVKNTAMREGLHGPIQTNEQVKERLLTFKDVVEIFRCEVYPGREGILDSFFKSLSAVLSHIRTIGQSNLGIDVFQYTESVRNQLNVFQLPIIYYFIHIDTNHLNGIQRFGCRLVKEHNMIRDLLLDKLVPISGTNEPWMDIDAN